MYLKDFQSALGVRKCYDWLSDKPKEIIMQEKKQKDAV